MLFGSLIMGFPIIFREPRFDCLNPLSDAPQPDYKRCTQVEFCENPEVNKLIEAWDINYSLTNSFNLVCQKRYFIGLAGSVFFLGGIFSGLFVSNLSNTKG